VKILVCETCCLALEDYLKPWLFERRLYGFGGEVTRNSEELHVNELHKVEYSTTVFGDEMQIVELLI
jgi:hypothetical protein